VARRWEGGAAEGGRRSCVDEFCGEKRLIRARYMELSTEGKFWLFSGNHIFDPHLFFSRPK
jgi:hypothetical protein